MKAMINIALAVAVISLVVGVISRLMVVPVPIASGIEAESFLAFTNTCLLVAVTFILLGILKK